MVASTVAKLSRIVSLFESFALTSANLRFAMVCACYKT
ncbi:hypothetical protein J478_1110 [Acinetobacter baumannii 58452]|nr:hypothetical protein J478_1110 [Acinetobacter baumannii 58452]